MTGELHVRVEAQTYDVETQRGIRLVGNVYAAATENSSLREVMIPLGAGVDPAVFTLTPGRYVVEATLPSGEVLSEDVDVADGESAYVGLDASASPYESHSWQYAIGNIEPGPVYHGAGTIPAPRSSGSRSILEGPEDALIGMGAAPAAAVLSWVPAGPQRALPFEFLDDVRGLPPYAALERVITSLGSPAPQVQLTPFTGDPQAPLYRFATPPPAGVPAHLPAPQYLTVEAVNVAYLITLPWPWRDTEDRDVVVEVLLNQRQSPTGSPVSVAVRDPEVGAGLAYMAAGALDKAAVVFADVRRMLFRKVSNPIAAAAAGFVLVGTETTGRAQEWDPWLSNLRDFFPRLSDGAILHATRLLRTAQDDGQVESARNALLEAYDRGVPVCTLGLTWLLDGLSSFPEDPGCARALQRVRQVCWRVDMREPFVVLRLGDAAP